MLLSEKPAIKLSASSRGFTLVELLVTVSIIAVLSAIGAAVYTNVIKEGRDSKRQSDLRSIQSALEQYYSDQFYYPVLLPLTTGGSLKSPDNSKTYINQIPTDPIQNPDYGYQASGTGCDASNPSKCTTYCLWAKLENKSPGLGGCPRSDNLYNFSVSPP